jgi:anti-sigma factor RsiW
VTCEEARDVFSALVDDACSAEERRAVETHLAGCGECTRELEGFRRTVVLVRSAAPARAPSGFVDRVLAAARPAPWYRRLARRLFLPLRVKLPIEAAAVAVVAILAVSLYRETPELQPATREDASRAAVRSEPPHPSTPAPGPSPTPPEHGQTEGARQKLEDVQSSTAAKRRLERDELRSSGREVGRAEETEALKRAAGQARGENAAPPPMAAPPVPATPTPGVTGARSSDLTAADVVGRLAVSDRSRAESAVADLVSRLGGATLAHRSDAGTTLVDVRIPRGAYADLIQGLAAIGRWQSEHEVSELPDQVHVTVRLSG